MSGSGVCNRDAQISHFFSQNFYSTAKALFIWKLSQRSLTFADSVGRDLVPLATVQLTADVASLRVGAEGAPFADVCILGALIQICICKATVHAWDQILQTESSDQVCLDVDQIRANLALFLFLSLSSIAIKMDINPETTTESTAEQY